MSALAALPDSHEAFVPGVGVVTLGEIRAEGIPALDLWQATLEMWGDIVTYNLGEPCQPGVSVSDVKALHVSRFMSAMTQRPCSSNGGITTDATGRRSPTP